MTNIILTISYGSHSECLTITQKTTWSDLCASIWDSSRLSVTQLYYRDREGDIIAFASDGELNSLKQDCTTGWLHLSIDPTNTARWVFDDSFVNQHEDPSIPVRTNSMPTTTSFTSQFERFGKLMDKYNDLIQRNEQVKAIMHQTATEITLQQSQVNLADLEIRLKNYQGNSKSLYPQHAKLSSTNLSRSATTATPRRMMKRTPSVSLYHDDNDQPWSTGYPDVPPPSYESQQPDENRDRRRHTTHYFENHSFPSSSWGEWPAYSSLHPPPQTIPSPQPTAPKLDVTPPVSVPSSPPDLIQHQQPHAQRPPMSLYPRPPILPALLKRTSRLLQNWVPPAPSPSLDSFSRKVGSSCSNNDNGTKAFCNDFAGGSCKRKQKGKQHANQNENRHTHYGLLEAIRDRHMYKEQQRSLRQQQKELARTQRHLKQQEKRDRSRPQPITIRKSSSLTSLSSISSLSSQSTCTSSSSSSPSRTLEQPLQYPSIPAPLIQHRRSTPPANHQHYGPRDNADDQSLDEKLDREDMEYLTHAFNQFSATNDGAKKEMIG